MLPITKNQNRKTHSKVFNLVLLALILIIWSCSTTETTDSTPRVDTIDLYETQVPLLYTGVKADGTPNTNLLLSGFVKYPADGRLLNFEVADNEYGITTDTTSGDLFQYSMLRVANSMFSNSISGNDTISINVVVTAKNGSGRATLTLTTDYDLIGDGLNFAGLNRRVVSDGCEVKAGILAEDIGGSGNSFFWSARFRPGNDAIIVTNITDEGGGLMTTNDSGNIALANNGFDGSGVLGIAYENNIFSGRYRLENSSSPLSRNVYPWYSALTFTIPRPNDPAFASNNEPYNANVRNGIPMTFFGITSTAVSPTNNFVDYQCNAS